MATTILVFCVGGLLSLGLVMLYSSSMVQTGARFLLMQLVWCAIALGGCALAAAIDYRWLKKVSWLLVLVALGLLIAVLVPPFRELRGGASRWIDLGFASFQASELAKLALIVALAHYMERHQRQTHLFTRGLVVPGILIVVFLGLIFVEPDYGTTLLLAAVCGVVLLTGGVRWRHFLPPVTLGTVVVVVAILQNPLRLNRILAWLNPEQFRMGTGYQADQAMVALGAGGVTGLGLGNGRQKLGFVPEHHTDFIFSIIGEELGLIGTFGVAVGFMMLVFCGLTIAARTRDMFGFLLATGITFLIGLQAFINMAVNTSVLPNKGLPLPFISYGGSNLLMSMVCVGLLISIARRNGETHHARELSAREIPSPAT
ncbi:MAG TPA: putative lipid II flippase FtsW [Methylomirabilota bacterium]|nr:putative lipid II flippase FtsW [Methylomirabilota bacterium]